MKNKLQSFLQWEQAANNAGSGAVSMPADIQLDKEKKKKKLNMYDGRTRDGKKFVERIMARRAAKLEKTNAK